MSEIVLQCEALTKHYGPVRAVDGLDVAVERGQILALLGPSGCGKTTTLRLLAGFERPDQGRILLEGRAISDARTLLPPERRGIGMVFQDYALFPHLTVADNVGFGLHRLRPAERADRIRAVLKLVGLAALEERYPHELSGGQQQRVALARALAPQPKVLLLDEPFSNLDADLRAQVRGEVEQILRSAATTAIFVTHDQEEAFAIADRVAVLNEGRLEQVGTAEEVYHLPLTRFVADFVGRADFLPGRFTGDSVETELGRWPAPLDLPPGTEVEVMLRPDDISLVADPGGAAVVEARQFRGEENIYTVRLPSGRGVHSSSPAYEVYAPRTSVRVLAHPPHVVVFAHKRAVPQKGPATSQGASPSTAEAPSAGDG
ncbi:MAG: ABC transporter ATP-binding protein [Chloroflexi bacterium]|nr:ABC transporter ATP-binding protein [Chloroflexota bacterium]